MQVAAWLLSVEIFFLLCENFGGKMDHTMDSRGGAVQKRMICTISCIFDIFEIGIFEDGTFLSGDFVYFTRDRP